MRARFSDFVFDSATRELTRRGEALRLSPKAFALLGILIENAPRAIAKEELYRRVWGEIFVEEANLPNLVSEIRAVLGENGRSFIKTVHGFGYAFSGAVTAERNPRRLTNRVIFLQWRREELPLHEGENVVGRGDEADVTIDAGAVSRRHARIVVDSGAVTVEDLGSKNGTLVSDARISGPEYVRDGDEIRFGMVAVVLRSIDRGASTMSAMPEDRATAD
jgi:DNA-binding winged helix-turn-helix (wHTH) protein